MVEMGSVVKKVGRGDNLNEGNIKCKREGEYT